MTAELLRDLYRPSMWVLLVDGAEQSSVDLDEPGWLEFEYMQMIAAVLDTADVTADVDRPGLRALHLGGGLCALPRWLAATRPEPRQTVVERSTEIQRLAVSLGGLDAIDWRLGDAVTLLPTLPAASHDVVVTDLYDGPVTVTRLFGADGLDELRARLAPGGVLAINLSDGQPFALARAVVAGLRERFAHVVVMLEPSVARGRRTGNVVLAATDGELDGTTLRRRVGRITVPVRLHVGAAVDAFVDGATVAPTAADLPRSGEPSGLRLVTGRPGAAPGAAGPPR